MSDRRKIGEVNPPFGNVKIYEAERVEQMFEDGIHNLSFSTSVVKIDLFQSRLIPVDNPQGAQTVRIGTNLPAEERTINLRLTIPTKAFIELCVNTLATLSQARGALESASDTETRALINLIDSIEIKKPL